MLAARSLLTRDLLGETIRVSYNAGEDEWINADTGKPVDGHIEQYLDKYYGWYKDQVRNGDEGESAPLLSLSVMTCTMWQGCTMVHLVAQNLLSLGVYRCF